ncbi:hypothetical protein HYQ45_004545 [Verticillium longisporum]|uniref:SAGA-associated factor 11 n=1 Tax=Verticillium longisporum TaxID=100787 RepID=A0A8I2ZUV3_VERLO|nr:hypothetical protein HYQ45_004545 [Verticillium longisporum]
MASNTGKAGVIVAPDAASPMDHLAHAVLDDLLYNTIHDILIKAHRDEKMARATTAVILAEKLASDASESSTPDSKPDVRIETDAAIYEDGKVTLKGNPLKTTKDILCPRCHLPRLLHPTDGKGARKPDPGVVYCKKVPYIDKPGFDIYGQTLNNHMGSCIGNSGRNASRAAAAKISNGSNGNSQNDGTPPSSQKATPVPTSRASSPKKRASEEAEEDGTSDASGPKKKKLKPSPMTKKVILKTNGPKKDKVKSGSLLSQEHKPDDDDGDNSTVEVAPKKKVDKDIGKGISPTKKLKLGSNKPPLSSPMSKNGREGDAESESSGTLSSPPHA